MKAAFYEKDITPPLGCYMPGYYSEVRAIDVLEPLYVRTAVFEEGGNIAAVIGVDACEFPNDMHDIVCKRINEYTGINADNVLISVTHTHKGAPIADSPEINCFSDIEYKNVVYRLIADSVTLAYKRLQTGELLFGQGYADDISFNRNYVMKDGSYKTNVGNSPEAVRTMAGIDPDVPVLYFKDENGTPKGAVISFACHQDCVRGRVYSGEFVYHLSEKLKDKYGRDFVIVFLPGASADINHINPKLAAMPDDFYITIAERLFEETVKAIDSGEKIKSDCISSCKELVTLPKREYNRDSIYADVEKFVKIKHPFAARNILYYYATNKTQCDDYCVQCIKFGDVILYAYPGEIFVKYGLDLKKCSPSSKNIISTLSNGGCGYVATEEAFAPNSELYEAMLCYGSCMKPEAGKIMNDKLIEMANKKARQTYESSII